MKTIKTTSGFRKIEDWDSNLIPVQLRSILKEHRASLIDKLLTGGLDTYIDYKFNAKTEPKQIERLKASLTELKDDGIDLVAYRSVFESVAEKEFTVLNNSIFYSEIDKIIKMNLSLPLFKETRQAFLY